MLTLDWHTPGMAELGGLEDGIGILGSRAAAELGGLEDGIGILGSRAAADAAPVALALFLVLRVGISRRNVRLRLNLV